MKDVIYGCVPDSQSPSKGSYLGLQIKSPFYMCHIRSCILLSCPHANNWLKLVTADPVIAKLKYSTF